MSELLATFGSTRGATVPMPRRSWRTRIALPAAILLLSASLIGGAAWNAFAPATEVDGVAVVLASLDRADDGERQSATPTTDGPSVQAAGWIEPWPYPIFATALAEGVIEEILVLEGDRVSKGQIIARLVSADATIAASRARAELARADAMLAAARTRLVSLVEPDRAIAVAEARAAGARAALDGFAAEEAVAEAALHEIEDELERKRPLVERGAVSAVEIARLGFRLDAQRAAIAALPARRRALEAALTEADAETIAARRARELLVEERAAVALAESERAIAAAGLEEAELRLARSEIRSPGDGVVLARLVAPGMMVSPSASSAEGGRVLSIYEPTRLQVRADVPNADIALVGVGQPVEVRVEALPNARIRGEVLRLTAQADIAKNTVQVKVRIIDPPPELRPEMLCRVRIGGGSVSDASAPGQSLRQRVFAPRSLLDGSTALVADSLRDGLARAASRTITLGVEERDGWIEVIDGLRPGDVLVDPRSAADGQRIRVTTRRGEEGGAS
jgi:HlyD family secretion protein